MQIQTVIDWISSTALSRAIQDNASWVVPTEQSFHIVGLAILAGSVLVSELRLLGILATDESPSAVLKRHLPWAWGGLALLIVTGLLLVFGEPERELTSQIFWLKMGLIVSGMLILLLFRMPLLNPNIDINSPARKWTIKPLAWLLFAIWIVVVCAGRWIAYGGWW